MKYKRIFTGSCETETALGRILNGISSINQGYPVKDFKDEYMLKVLTTGRCGKGDAYEGSNASDDVGGFLRVEDEKLFLTDKAVACITL